jgi:putative YhdH/YhfP family quinone oxidoreductase
MEDERFRAMVVREQPDGTVTRAIEDIPLSSSTPGDVLMRVVYSSLNYKDALSASGKNRGVTKEYPHTPGIDAAGLVVESHTPAFQPGEEVIVNGRELGVSQPGGFGQYLWAPEQWLTPLPENLSLFESMVYGVAGFTAAQCVLAIQAQGVRPGSGDVLVTGATGGVGSIAVALLAKEGFRVVAATGKLDERSFLESLGAADVIHRDEVLDSSGRPLLKGRWAGVVDTVGGDYLASAVRATQLGGAVAACGNAAGTDLHLTVFPFILRGVSLLGIDTAQVPQPKRAQVWSRLAGDWKLPHLERLGRRVSLEDLSVEINRILRGEQVGRVVVDLWPGGQAI